MKQLTTALILGVAALSPIGAHDRPLTQAPSGRETRILARDRGIAQAYGNLPIGFEANRGQVDPEVQFVGRAGRYTVFLAGPAAVVTVHRPAPRAPDAPTSTRRRVSRAAPVRFEQANVRMTLVGAARDATPEPLDELRGRVNHFKGASARRWTPDVPTFARVRYAAVYPGIDLVYYSNGSELEYDFVAAAGADPSAIRLAFQGAAFEVAGDGDLVGALGAGEIRMKRPVIYQQGGGERHAVAGRWVVNAKNEAGFALGPYDRSKPLVIDPVLAYSTYLGGNGDDSPMGVAVDDTGHAYIGIQTVSADYPVTAGVFQETLNAPADMVVSKLNPTGTGLVYSTFIGGSGDDAVIDIALDDTGHVYLACATNSTDLPTTGAFQASLHGEVDACVAKLNPTGTALVYASYLGGTLRDDATGIALAGDGSVYLTGSTNATDFPVTSGAFQTSYGGGLGDAFVTKVNPAGSALVYSTYLGGGGNDHAAAIDVDPQGSAYVTGGTRGGFPITAGAFQPAVVGLSDEAFVTKLTPDGSALAYSTYLGGAANEGGFGIAVDAAGHAYVVGAAQSADFPITPGAYQTTLTGDEGFVTKFDPAGASLVYSTFLGGAEQDWTDDIVLDSAGTAYIMGTTRSPDFPVTAGAAQASFGGFFDAFVSILDSAGTALTYSTFLGGSEADFGMTIAVDAGTSVYGVGFVSSTDFPVTAGAFQQVLHGDRDGFVVKLAADPPAASLGKVKGEGRLRKADGGGRFEFVVDRKRQDRPIRGELIYFDRSDRLRLRARDFTSLAISGDTATFGGTCVLNARPCTFTVTVVEGKGRRSADRFVLTIGSDAPIGGIVVRGDIRIRE